MLLAATTRFVENRLGLHLYQAGVHLSPCSDKDRAVVKSTAGGLSHAATSTVCERPARLALVPSRGAFVTLLG
jgi:hypothetical protein